MSDFIELGRKYGSGPEVPCKPSDVNKVDYPSLYISGIKSGSDLDEMPEEGEAVIRYKMKRFTDDLSAGECSVDLSVVSIKPSAKRAKRSKSSEDSLDDELTKIAKSKK